MATARKAASAAEQDAPDAQATEVVCVRMVRAQGYEEGFPPECMVHPNEVDHMIEHNWVMPPEQAAQE